MILTKKMQDIMAKINDVGYYRITALTKTKTLIALRRMADKGMLKTLVMTESYIDVGKNWN